MFNIASAPFAHNRKQTQTLMVLVILACLPGFWRRPGSSAGGP